MARTLWSGSISFGLVNIPVKVVGAVTDKDIHFTMLHAKDGARIRFKRVCSKEEKEVPNTDIVKGAEIGPDQYVTFTDDELEGIDPKGARTIDIVHFVDQIEIDSSYYDKPHYLIPDKNAGKAYRLFLETLQKTDKVGIARVIMREKERLVALRANGGVLMMETMHFHDEVIPPKAISAEVGELPAVDTKQLHLAEQIVESMSAPFDASEYEDRHRARLQSIIDEKAKGHEVIASPQAPVTAKATDLLTALEESLKSVAKGGHGGNGRKVVTTTASGKKERPARKR